MRDAPSPSRLQSIVNLSPEKNGMIFQSEWGYDSCENGFPSPGVALDGPVCWNLICNTFVVLGFLLREAARFFHIHTKDLNCEVFKMKIALIFAGKSRPVRGTMQKMSEQRLHQTQMETMSGTARMWVTVFLLWTCRTNQSTWAQRQNVRHHHTRMLATPQLHPSTPWSKGTPPLTQRINQKPAHLRLQTTQTYLFFIRN